MVICTFLVFESMFALRWESV